MPRPRKCRRVCAAPRCTRFEPFGAADAEAVVLQVDEFETLRLMDYEGLTQEACALRMGVARTTITGIYTRARRKVAVALAEGRPLHIHGGAFEVCTGGGCACGHGSCPRAKDGFQP
ncbi:MAG TPA: DUF134 domain-containing protein [Candidatus Pullichristensenella stercorigallinarum]|uniref:UPF0251 protein IAA52_00955 n=1 Tax=Candidatus Pullichristensenella stercorigallinarum TaxID=2840909 RepID=A0A9D1CVE5_9FIRM|nr:DUF134 domain-containing protein [Candidatus Pullichristensenella stercorigallinarum]